MDIWNVNYRACISHLFTATDLILFISVVFLFSACNQDKCIDGNFYGAIVFTNVEPTYFRDATVELVDSTSNQIIYTYKLKNDSISIGDSKRYTYYFPKPVSIAYNWRFNLSDGSHIIMSNIKMKEYKERTMFSEISLCSISTFEIDGETFYNQLEGPNLDIDYTFP